MRMTMLILTLLMSLCMPAAGHAQELNAGFVQGLWYSKEPIFANETIRIYAALRNNTEHDLTATVRFYVDDVRIATKAISALPGRLIESWADWTAAYGEYTIRAELVDVKVHAIGEIAEAADVVSMFAEDVLIIDYDTDGDGIGNREDSDDDGDGASDEAEVKSGTDPLTYDAQQSAEPEQDDTESSETEDFTEESAHMANAEKEQSAREGFERFTPDGPVNTVLTNVTERITEARSSLDAYRNERSKRKSTEKEDTSISHSDTTTADHATITRTRIAGEERGIVSAVLNGVKNIFGGLYTVLLLILSKALAHPALVQLVLLLGILYGTYRLARRLGRRQFE